MNTEPTPPDQIKRQTASAERFPVGSDISFLGVPGIVSDFAPARATRLSYAPDEPIKYGWDPPTIWFKYLDRNGVIQDHAISGELLNHLG